MESTIYIFIVVYLFRDIASMYLPKTKKMAFFFVGKGKLAIRKRLRIRFEDRLQRFQKIMSDLKWKCSHYNLHRRLVQLENFLRFQNSSLSVCCS